jgi:hypothetical protein
MITEYFIGVVLHKVLWANIDRINEEIKPILNSGHM